jgi:hypothetical protein
MTSLYLVALVGALGLLFFRMLVQPEKAYEFPWFMGAAFAVFILPQAFSLVRFPGDVSEQSVSDVLAMCLLCLSACVVGYRLPPNQLLFQGATRAMNPDRLLHVGIAFIVAGYYFNWALGHTDVQVNEAGGMTGTGTILLFFQQLVFPGFAICLRLALERPTLLNIIGSVAGIILPVQTAVAGRREPAVLLGMTIMLGLFFARGIKPPRWLIALAMAGGMLAIPATGTYRGLRAEKDWEAIRQIDLVGNFKKFLTEGSILELRNGAAVIESTKTFGAYEYGAGYWNHLVFRYVPAQIVGQPFKDSLKIHTQWDAVEAGTSGLDFQFATGSTITGMGDSFQQFGWFGCLVFGLMALFFRSLWAAAQRPAALFAQLLYIASCTSAMRAVTHWTLDFLPGLLYNVIFLAIGMVYAAAPYEPNPKSEAGQARTEETEDRIVAKKWWQKHGAAKIAQKSGKIREGRSETRNPKQIRTHRQDLPNTRRQTSNIKRGVVVFEGGGGRRQTDRRSRSDEIQPQIKSDEHR